MPKKNEIRSEKLYLLLGEEELKAIDDWRFAHRFPSRAAAVRELLRRGILAALNTDSVNKKAASSGDFRVVDDAVKEAFLNKPPRTKAR